MRKHISLQLVKFNWQMYVARNELKKYGKDAKVQVDWPTLVGWPDMGRFYHMLNPNEGKITFANGSSISFFDEKMRSQLAWDENAKFAFEDAQLQLGINPIKVKPSNNNWPKFQVDRNAEPGRYFYCHGFAVRSTTKCPGCGKQMPL